MCEAPPPPDLTQPQPSARMRAELEKALQHYLEHAIWPELSRGFPNPMQLTLKIRLDPARRVQQCYGWQAQGEQEQLANAICGHLHRTPPPLQHVPLEAGFDTMEIPVTLTWPSAAMTPH